MVWSFDASCSHPKRVLTGQVGQTAVKKLPYLATININIVSQDDSWTESVKNNIDAEARIHTAMVGTTHKIVSGRRRRFEVNLSRGEYISGIGAAS